METSGKPNTDRTLAQSQDKVESSVGANPLERVRECGEIAAMRFSGAFAEALKQAGDNLFNKGLHGTTIQEQENWLKAADFAKKWRQAMVDSFRKHFELRFTQMLKPRPALLASRLLDFDASQLKIERHDVLEAGLNPDKLVEAIRNTAWTSLPPLAEWFRDELAIPELSPNDMPLCPKLVGGVASQAIEDQFGVPAVKEIVLSSLCRTFPERVNQVYRDLAAHVTTLPAADAAPLSPALPPSIEVKTEAAPGHAPTLEITDEAEAMAASRAASEALDPWLSGKRLPGFIADFLGGPWRAVLAHIHQEHGAISPEWDTAMATLEALIDSLRLKHSAEERGRMMKALPDLVRRLGKGLELIAEPVEARRAFFARLAEYHLKVIQKAQTEPAAVKPAAPAHEAAAKPVAEAARLESLQTGTWLEVRTPQGAFQKLKLAWISPQRNLFLLTNTLGERVLSLGAENFAALLREGNARIVQSTEGGKPGGLIVNKPQFRKIG